MIPIKNAASGATYMTPAKIARMVARSRRRLVTDNAMAERARTGPSTPSHKAESTLNQRASVGSASISHANRYPSENCQIKKPARMMMTMRRTPSVLLGHSLGMNDTIAPSPCRMQGAISVHTGMGAAVGLMAESGRDPELVELE